MFQRLNVCGATRILIPAFFSGMAVTAFTTNETLAWIVAAVVAAAIWVFDRIRGASTTCAVPVGTAKDHPIPTNEHATHTAHTGHMARTGAVTIPTNEHTAPMGTETIQTKG